MFVADLGSDLVRVLQHGGAGLAALPPLRTAPGAGPRHVAIHPALSKVYVVNELNSTIEVFAYDIHKSEGQREQTVSTLPPSCEQPSFCAAIRISSSGSHVYVSNRGHDSIAIFSVDASSGLLTWIACESTQGKYPRDIQIVGDWMIAANQVSGQCKSCMNFVS